MHTSNKPLPGEGHALVTAGSLCLTVRTIEGGEYDVDDALTLPRWLSEDIEQQPTATIQRQLRCCPTIFNHHCNSDLPSSLPSPLGSRHRLSPSSHRS